jgi:2-isopropylmalate synthase
MKADIESASMAIAPATRKRIHTFIASSPIHMKHKLGKNPSEVLEMAREAVKISRNLVEDVEFSAEDGTRSEWEFLRELVEAVIEEGASTINIPDTVGYTTPEEYGKLFAFLKSKVKGAEKVIFSAHCHNDLGLAVANSLAAVLNGARQIECTINGIGERAGNTAMEEIAMAMRTRKDFFGIETNIETTHIARASYLVKNITGMVVQPNKAIVGRNAFAHSSGIHQDGVLKHRENYEIIDPKEVGVAESTIVLTARSGRAALKHHLDALGVELEGEALREVYEAFLVLADSKRDVGRKDLLELVGKYIDESNFIELEHVHYSSDGEASARVTLKVGNALQVATATGVGPVDAVLKAIESIVQPQVELEEFLIQAMTQGSDDVAKVHMRLIKSDKPYYGFASNQDIVLASAQAFVDALNKIPVKEYATA